MLNASVCVAKCCINSNESCANVKSFTPHALGKCNRVFRAPRAEIAKNSAINSSFDDADFARARRQTRRFSSQNAPPTQPRAVPTFQSFSQRRRLDWWCVAHHRRRKFATSSRTFARKIFTILAESALHANFLRHQTLHRLKRGRGAASNENAAPPPARILQPSRVLCSARSRNSRKFCNNFENFWLFLRGKFARSRC